MDQESIVLEIDPRWVHAAIVQANKDVEAWEKGAVGAGERMQKSLERMADMLLKMNDKSRSSMERLAPSSALPQNSALESALILGRLPNGVFFHSRIAKPELAALPRRCVPFMGRNSSILLVTWFCSPAPCPSPRARR